MVTLFDTKCLIADTTYTTEWLIGHLTKNDKTFSDKTKSSKIARIEWRQTGRDSGFTSKIYFVTVFFENVVDTVKVVLKVARPERLIELYNKNGITSITAEERLLLVEDLYNHEIAAVNYLSPNDKILIPKIYATESVSERASKGAILMEYFPEDSMIGLLEPLNKNQIISITNVIAELVAFSLTVKPTSLEHFNFSPHAQRFCLELIQSGIRTITSSNREALKEKIARIQHLGEGPSYLRYINSGINQDLGTPTVLVHGDIHPSNIFWKKNEAGDLTDDVQAIIDWQFVHCGNVCEDLAGVLVMYTDAKTRRDAEKWILRSFHELIQEKLRKAEVEIPLTLDQIRHSYGRCLVRHALYFISTMAACSSKNDANLEEQWQRLTAAIDDSIKIINEEVGDPSFADCDPSTTNSSIFRTCIAK